MTNPANTLPPRYLRTPEAVRFLGLSGRTLERVVALGQFLIDSEASLSGALERLEASAQSQAGRPAASHEAAAASLQ